MDYKLYRADETRRPDRKRIITETLAARNDIGFEAVRTSRVRVLLEHPAPDASGVTEIVILGPGASSR